MQICRGLLLWVDLGSRAVRESNCVSFPEAEAIHRAGDLWGYSQGHSRAEDRPAAASGLPDTAIERSKSGQCQQVA